VVAWLKDNRVRVLNVAGPRESTSPGVYQLAADFLATLLGEVGRV
ncbi:MAG: molybdenum cofactor carrier, partial [Candidatus Hydrogenedentes bacterium]|nr:molybdenum cofactor carrier [Candidatus Hydrogenedentota bacterium]